MLLVVFPPASVAFFVNQTQKKTELSNSSTYNDSKKNNNDFESTRTSKPKLAGSSTALTIAKLELFLGDLQFKSSVRLVKCLLPIWFFEPVIFI